MNNFSSPTGTILRDSFVSPATRSGLPRGEVPCVVRHLAFAAGDLARVASQTEAESGRYRRAEAAFRSLADAEWIDPAGHADGPSVILVQGRAVSLVDLLAGAWESDGRPFPGRRIDPEMVEAARQLLRELAWHCPA